MSDCKFHPYLGSYHDEELEAETARRVESHLAACPACAAELTGLRALSMQIAGAGLGRIQPAEMARVHEAVERVAGGEHASLSLVRTARFLAAMAASVLVISGIWLLDARRADRGIGSLGSPSVALAAEWERVAVTLRADPRPGLVDDSLFSPRYASAVDWMLSSLVPMERKPWAKPSSS